MRESELSISDSDLLTYKVAVLASQGLKQAQIVERLGYKQPAISKKMKQAVERKLLEIPTPIWRGPPEIHREVERLLHPVEELLERLQAQSKEARRLLEVQIIENPLDALHEAKGRKKEKQTSESQEGDGERKRSEFARRVAAYLLDDRLPRVGTVGVAWGGTLVSLSGAVEEQVRRPLEGFEGIKFVPICGDPPEVDQSPTLAAANIAARLETALTGRKDFPHSFSSVASCIPDGFSGERAETIRAFFRTFPGYQAVFGKGRTNRGGMIWQLDGMLTSVGTNESGASWLAAAARAAAVDPEALAAASAGNIGGLFVERWDASDGDRRLVKRVNDRWTGFRFDHLERCARAAAGDAERMGVVVIAGRGASQASTARECVRRGYVNRLLLDPNTAAAVEKLL